MLPKGVVNYMHILHINLAKGFRGGERQTGLLIDGLTEAYPKIKQTLLVRDDSPLPDALKKKHKISVIKIRKPYILSIFKIKNDVDIIHAHEAKACHIAYLLAKKNNTPYIITRRMDRAPKRDWFTKNIYRNVSHIVSLSSAIETIILKQYPLAESTIIPSMNASLVAEANAVNKITQQYPNKIIVGHIGALVKKHKGQHLIIDAAKELERSHSNIQFLLLGSGKDEEALKKQAQGLKNVVFLGYHYDVGNYIRTFDIFIFPSLEEGLGSTLLDVMEAKIPIIASSAGGIPDIIRHNENGILIPPKDSSAIIDAILMLIENKKLAQQLSEKGYSEVQKYRPDTISRRYMAIYKNITQPI
jgi:glycosyltransferase involved in cell wall biosynthesis